MARSFCVQFHQFKKVTLNFNNNKASPSQRNCIEEICDKMY